jgi:hypothetical protein
VSPREPEETKEPGAEDEAVAEEYTPALPAPAAADNWGTAAPSYEAPAAGFEAATGFEAAPAAGFEAAPAPAFVAPTEFAGNF